MKTDDVLKNLNQSFGSYRAEWLKNQIFELFAEPLYFPGLQDNRPCVLEGGRGTGKTTALRGLSYQGQYAILDKDIEKFNRNKFIGIYHRVNTNHVRAFIGGELSDKKWELVFAHYFNLLICREILIFLKWYETVFPSADLLSPYVCSLVARCINQNSPCKDISDLLYLFDIEMYSFQSKINNIADGELPQLSLAGDPIKVITEHAINLRQFNDKTFFILLDEYENYTDYQQKILNTLIKHSSEHYTFKIGVREMGWRIKHTTNSDELLSDPADYILINIEQKLTENDSTFSDFAKKVCQQRIRTFLGDQSDEYIFEIESSLKGLSIEEEAILLDVNKVPALKAYSTLPTTYKNKLRRLSPLYKYFISYWCAIHQNSLLEGVVDYCNNKDAWDIRYENYKYEMLFKIRRGRGKSGIQKYYSGWSTYTKLANGNIRYLMELVYRAYERHLSSDNDLRVPVSPKDQTIAAQDTGLKNLMELEGLWKDGAKLTKLLLGMGRVFQVLAIGVGKSAPEKNQFSIEAHDQLSSELDALLRAAVMHLALIRTPGNKLSEAANTRDYIYMIHPIYSAYFQFSHRRKRKLTLKPSDITGIIDNPKSTISNILKRSHAKFDTSESMPSQMNLFEKFYNE